MYVYVWACVLMYACIYVYIHLVFMYVFFVFCFFFHSLSWPPLFLGTSNRRRNVWCPQPSTYPITHRHQEMQSQMKTEEVTLEPISPLKRTYTPPSIEVLFPLNQCKSSFRKFMTNSSQHTPPITTKTWYKTSSHINWGRILSSYQRLILSSHSHQNLQKRNK